MQGRYADWDAFRAVNDVGGEAGSVRIAIVFSERFRAIEDVSAACTSALPGDLQGVGFAEVTGTGALYVVAESDSTESLERYEVWRASIKASVGGLVTVGLGGATSDLSELPRSLSEARNALEYRFVFGEDRVIEPADYARRSWNPHWFPAQELEELDTTLRAGDVDRTRALFAEVVRTIRESRLPMPEVRGLAFEVIRLVRRSFVRYEYLRIAESTDADDVEAFLRVRSIDHLAQIVERVAEEASLVISDRKRVAIRSFREDARAFIDEHYLDASFSAEFVAEHFRLSLSNFSQRFSRAFGESFQEYLIATRMERAKDLLSTTQTSIAEIAFEVGYTDVSGFIRRFKSVVGVTPARYRDRV